MTEQSKTTEKIPQTLGDEEEAWYRHDAKAESIPALKEWLRHIRVHVHQNDNPLANEEDAWCRR